MRQWRSWMALDAFADQSSAVKISEAASAVLGFIRQGLVQGQRWQEIRSKCQSSIQPEIVGELLKNVRDASLAWLLFKWGQEVKQCSPTILTYRCFLEALLRSGHFSLAQSTYREMVTAGFGQDEYAFCLTLAGICNSGGDWRDPLYEIRDRADSGFCLTVNMFNVILEGLVKQRRLMFAQEVFSTMDSMMPPNLTSYKVMIKAFAGEYRITEVKFYHEQMMQQTKLQPDAETYELLIEAHSSVFLQDEACGFLSSMLERGLVPGVQTYVNLLRCCLHNWDAKAGYQFFRRIEEAGYDLHGGVYQEMLDGFWNSRMVEETRRLMKEMVSRGFKPSKGIYAGLIVAFACPGRFEEACNIYQELVAAGHEVQVETYLVLVERLSKMDLADEAKKIYDRMLEDHAPDQAACRELVSCLCRTNRVETAREIVVGMKKKNVVADVETYNCLLAQYCGSGLGFRKELQVGKALEVFDEMVKSGRWPNVGTFGVVVHGLCKAGRVMDAYEVFLTIREFDLVADAAICKTLIRGLCEMDRVVEAELVFDHLIGGRRERCESRVVVSLVYKVIVEAKMKQRRLQRHQ